jgi:MoaA/NifB/PqqE/SkfB family radical SAM enzyme
MSVFKPFTQMTPKQIREIVNGRKIYIWGLCANGYGISSALKRNGFTVSGFIDSDKLLHGTIKQGLKVFSPDEIIRDGVFKDNFVFTALTRPSARKEVHFLLEKFGAKPDTDYITHTKFCNYFPSIDISGACNLKCIACPRGSGDYFHGKHGFMSLDDYRAVAKKLLREIPMLGYVSLYIWGEPLIHPQITEIIKINKELGIPDNISTNLNNIKNLEEIIAAEPVHLYASCSGFGPEHYEITHTGGKWNEFYNNLIKVSELIEKYGNKTSFRLYYHVNKINAAEYPKLLELCNSLKIPVGITSSRLFPVYALEWAETGKLTPEAKKAADLMPVSLEDMMTFARNSNDKICVSAQGFPSINFDRKVFTCCNLGPDDFIADDFLTVPLDELVISRNNSELCKRCIKTSVFRYYEKNETYKITLDLIDEVMKKADNKGIECAET